MLETVLKNSQINAVPQTSQAYSELTLSILENKEKCSINVAFIVRSLVDTLRFDTKLEQLVVREFGFSYHSRIFHSKPQDSIITSDLSNSHNHDESKEKKESQDIG